MQRHFSPQILWSFLLLFFVAALAAAQIGGTWRAEGPGPATGGDVDNIVPDDEVVGAVRVVVPHPTNSNVLWVGAVNGGVWRTTNARAQRPQWTRLTDGEAAISIGDLDLDPTDSTNNTLLAGIGLFSSYGEIGSPRLGLLRSTNGGNSWTAIDGGGRLRGMNIAGVAARGATLVVAAEFGLPNTFDNVGVFRSTDGGASFAQISTGDGSATGLPGGQADDLTGDPNNSSRLFTSIVFAGILGGQDGIYRSDNTGATWTKVSTPEMDGLLDDNRTTNVRIAVGELNNVFVAIVRSNGCIGGLFRSGNGGNTWTRMDTPDIHNSCQGRIHFSISADPTDSFLVYLGGDLFNRFEVGGFAAGGRLVRCDASRALGGQCVFLSSVATADGGGTASGSETHADSRSMAFDAQGELIEGGDGGVYRRTLPRSNQGDWFSMNGDLQLNEAHSAAYDPVAGIILAGAQDTGTLAQAVPGGRTWFTVDVADGGDVAIDSVSTANRSVRYSSEQFLGLFRREVYDQNNNMLSVDFPPVAVDTQVDPICTTQFTHPIALNAVDPFRLIFGCFNNVYESSDQAESIRMIGPGIRVTGSGSDAIAAGAAGNAGVLFVGGQVGGAGDFDHVFVRATLGGALTESTSYPGRGSGRTVRSIVLDPSNDRAAFVADDQAVFRTTNQGASWSEITGNLPSFDLASPDEFLPFLRSLEYIESTRDDALVAGTTNGVFAAFASSGFSTWQRLGSGLPAATVFELDYDASDDLLLASTLGRGAFTLDQPLGDDPPPPPPPTGDGLDTDFEGDVSGWVANGLWHLVTNSGCAPGFNSPVRAFYYGQDTSCTYDTGAANSGTLTSPTITGVGQGSTLTFAFRRQVESFAGDFDIAAVEVSSDDGLTFTEVFSLSARDASQNAWGSSPTIDISAFAAPNVRVRFRFDTVDNVANGFLGWMIDDVVVTAGGAPPPPPPPPTVVLDADFEDGDEGFSYSDDTFFGTSQPAFANGDIVPAGFTGDAIRVVLGGVDDADILNMSGGWSRSFTLASAQSLELVFRYNLSQAPDYESDEFVDAIVTFDGNLLSGTSQGIIDRITGNGNGGGTQSTGWVQLTVDLGTVSAGTHTLVFGAFNNKKTLSNEFSEVRYDDIVVRVP